MPNLKRKRKSFSFGFKNQVISRAEKVGNRAAAREYEIDESMIRYWRKNKPKMEQFSNKKRTCRHGKVRFPILERTLNEWVITHRNSCRVVTTVMIRLKAKDLANQMNLTDFVGGPSWCYRFMKQTVRPHKNHYRSETT